MGKLCMMRAKEGAISGGDGNEEPGYGYNPSTDASGIDCPT